MRDQNCWYCKIKSRYIKAVLHNLQLGKASEYLVEVHLVDLEVSYLIIGDVHVINSI